MNLSMNANLVSNDGSPDILQKKVRILAQLTAS